MLVMQVTYSYVNAFHTLSIELSLITCCILIFTFPKQEKKNLSLMKIWKNYCEENNLLMKFGILMPNATAITTNIKFTEACPSKKSDSVFFPATQNSSVNNFVMQYNSLVIGFYQNCVLELHTSRPGAISTKTP